MNRPTLAPIMLTSIAAVCALSACGGSDIEEGSRATPTAPTTSSAAPTPSSSAPTTSVPITESPATAAPSSTPSSTTTQTAVADLGPEVVEDAITGTIGCTIDEEFGRGRSQVGYLLTALGPDGVEQPHEAIDGSCTCGVEPTGSQNYVVVRFVDSGQASAMATWLSGGDRCRPIATVGSWMLFSIKDLAQPQASDEFEAAVTALGGELITTCR